MTLRGEGALGFCTPTPHIRYLKLRFRPYGDSLFSNAKKVSKNAMPRHPGLAALDFPHSIMLRGPAAEGHPWPIAALAASMPLNPLHNDSVRPSERGNWCRTDRSLHRRIGWTSFALSTLLARWRLTLTEPPAI